MLKGSNKALDDRAVYLKRHRLKNSILSNTFAWMLMIPSLLAMLLFNIRPLLMGVQYSFFSMQGFEPLQFCGLQNYKDVLSDLLFTTAFANTFKYVFWSLVFGFIPPIILAVMINEAPYFKGGFRFLIYFPAIIPSMVASLLFVFAYRPDATGLLNMILEKVGLAPQIWLDNKQMTIPLIMVSSSWVGIGGTTIYYLAALQGINRDLYEAAMIDGAGIFTRFRKIMLPHLIPIMMLFLVRQMIGVFGIMQEPLVMTGGGPDHASLSLGLLSYHYTFTYGYTDKGLALGVIQFLIGLVFTLFYVLFDKKLSEI